MDAYWQEPGISLLVFGCTGWDLSDLSRQEASRWVQAYRNTANLIHYLTSCQPREGISEDPAAPSTVQYALKATYCAQTILINELRGPQ